MRRRIDMAMRRKKRMNLNIERDVFLMRARSSCTGQIGGDANDCDDDDDEEEEDEEEDRYGDDEEEEDEP